MNYLEIAILFSLFTSLILLEKIAILLGGIINNLKRYKVIKCFSLYSIAFTINVIFCYTTLIKIYGTTYLSVFLIVIILGIIYYNIKIGADVKVITQIINNKIKIVFYYVLITIYSLIMVI